MSGIMSKLRSIGIILLVTMIYIAVFGYTGLRGQDTSNFTSSIDDIYKLAVKPVFFAFFTIVGIFSKVILEEIRSHKKAAGEKNISISSVLNKGCFSKTFLYTILACPLIALTFYPTLNEISSNSLLGLLSYQNGFFFRSVFPED